MFKLISIILLLSSQNLFAKDIHCAYKNYTENVSFKIKDPNEYSLTETKKDKKYTYYFFIKNIHKFDEIEDYVVITDKKGHNVTYVLNCR